MIIILRLPPHCPQRDIQHSIGIRILCIGWNVINVCWNDVGVLELDRLVRVWLAGLQRVFPQASLWVV